MPHYCPTGEEEEEDADRWKKGEVEHVVADTLVDPLVDYDEEGGRKMEENASDQKNGSRNDAFGGYFKRG